MVFYYTALHINLTIDFVSFSNICDHSSTQAIEALLAGSIRRERAAEEVMTQQAAEIEQLNRLVLPWLHYSV